MDRHKIPLWIYIFQGLLCLILAQQAISYYQLNYWGEIASSISEKRELLELAGRTLAMLLVGIIVMISRNASFFVVLFLLNVFREASETIVDPMYESGTSPLINVGVHLLIVALEVWALITVYKLAIRSSRKHPSVDRGSSTI